MTRFETLVRAVEQQAGPIKKLDEGIEEARVIIRAIQDKEVNTYRLVCLLGSLDNLSRSAAVMAYALVRNNSMTQVEGMMLSSAELNDMATQTRDVTLRAVKSDSTLLRASQQVLILAPVPK